MTELIKNLKKNQFARVEKSHLKCPCCNSDLYTDDNQMLFVMDGNNVYQCETHEDHRFWQNSRESSDYLHLNKNASETTFDSEKDFKLLNDKWFQYFKYIDKSDATTNEDKTISSENFPKLNRITEIPLVPCTDIPEMTDEEFDKIKKRITNLQKNANFCLKNAHLIHGEAACNYFLFQEENSIKNKKILRILVACEESQTVAKAFRNLGHEAFSCDILPCSGGHPEWHLQQDVIELLQQKWDIIIAHPPCTHLTVSGSRFFKVKREDGRQREAIDFFVKFINADCQMIAVENPIGIISGNYVTEHFSDLAEKYQLPLKHSQIIQPFEFGDPVKKSTCLWLKGLPKLKPTNNVAEQVQYYINKKGVKESEWNMRQLVIDGKKYGYNSIEFKKHRSKTFQGIADAIATQYTAFVLSGLSVNDFEKLTLEQITNYL